MRKLKLLNHRPRTETSLGLLSLKSGHFLLLKILNVPLISAYVVLVVEKLLEITCIKHVFVITVTNFIKSTCEDPFSLHV